MTDDDLRTKIAAVLAEHRSHGNDCQCGWEDHTRLYDPFTGHELHQADVVLRELNIPNRTHTDDQGRTWEWCGGQPGTWAWRITANGPIG